MTDRQAVKLAYRISAMNWKMTQLVDKFADHPNGQAMIDALRTNGYQNPADSEDVIAHHLLKPELFEKEMGTGKLVPVE